MKKTSFKIIKSMVALMLFCLLLGLLGADASAQTAQSMPFLNGYNLAVVSTTTNLFNGTNIYAKGFYVTNSGTYPYTSSIVAVTVTNTGAITDVPLWANRDGTTPLANISVQIHGLNAAFTNTGLFKFAAIPAQSRSANYPPGLLQPATAAQNLLSFSVTGNGTNVVCLASNLVTASFQGSRAIRFLGVEWTNAGTNGFVDGVFLNGSTPQ